MTRLLSVQPGAAGTVRRTALCVLAVACLLVGSAAHAQRVEGTLTLPGGAPAVGVQIVAARTDGAPLEVRSLSGASGRFVLELPPTSLVLSARRIGYRPEEIARLELRDGERTQLRVELVSAPLGLMAVTAESRARCAPIGRAAPDLVALVDDVRQALYATQLPSVDGVPRARVVLSEQVTTLDGAPLRRADRELRTGITARPFQSIDPATLRATGYVSTDETGTVYRAPDSRVLTSDAFLADHCFRTVADTSLAPEWLAIAFEPVDKPRGLVGITGTFWLDRATRELRQLEFSYVGLPSALRRVPAGGTVDFTRLPDGSWFERRWELRMPRTTIEQSEGDRRSPSPLGGEVRVDALQVVGGEVIDLRRGAHVVWVGNQVLANEAVLSRATPEPPVITPLPTTVMSVCGTPEPGALPTGLITGTVFDRTPVRVQGALVLAEWPHELQRDRDSAWEWVTRSMSLQTNDSGEFQLCGVPIEREVRVTVMREDQRSRSVAVRLSNYGPRVRVALALRDDTSDAVPSGATDLSVTTVDGTPIPYAMVTAGKEVRRVADAAGGVTVPVTGRDSVRVHVSRIGYESFSGAVARAADGSANVALQAATAMTDVEPREASGATVTPRPRARDSVLETGGFYARVLRSQLGAFAATYLTPEDFAVQPVYRISQRLSGTYGLLRVLAPGTPSSTALRGAGGCEPTVIRDGVRLIGTELVDAIPADRALVGLEVYERGTDAPSELTARGGVSSCELVVIWTAEAESRRE